MCTTEAIIPHPAPNAQPSTTVKFLIQDGVHFNAEINEYEVWIDGEPVAWASTQSQAWRSYHEMLRVHREHIKRNPANAAPAEPEPAEPRSILINAAGQTSVMQVPGADRPFDYAQDRPLYDLVIASRKYGYGSTTHADAPIIWWKVAGQQKAEPSQPVSITHPLIQKRLQQYELVDTEVHPTEVIRKYRKVEERRFSHAPGDGGLVEADIPAEPSPEYRRMLAQELARRGRENALEVLS